MNHRLKFFLVTIQMTFLASIIVGLSAVIIYYVTLPSTLNIINPPPPTPLPPCPYLSEGETSTESCDPHASFSMFPAGAFHNFGESILYSLVLFLFTICVVGFGLGFYLNRRNLYPHTRIWLVLIIGLISGGVSYIIYLFVFERRTYDMIGYIGGSLFCIVPVIAATLVGYYVAGWRKLSNISDLT